MKNMISDHVSVLLPVCVAGVSFWVEALLTRQLQKFWDCLIMMRRD